MSVSSVVIVGAGVAGVSAAEGLRRRGYTGRLTLIGAERHPPYDRPPLSKHVLDGSWAPERATLFTDARFAALGARFLSGHRAVGVDDTARTVLTSTGGTEPYDALVVATGLRARTIGEGGHSNVLTLRTLADSRRLGGFLVPSARLLVVGGGFLGLEAAATAASLGCRVTVVEPFPESLAHKIGAIAATRLAALHRERGVRIVGGQHVAEFETEPDGRVSVARLSGGGEVKVDVVLAAVGATPELDWLAGTSLLVEDGLVCDEYCRAGAGVWAAGDVARWLHPALGEHLRLEHRQCAWDQGDAVAADIMGEGSPYSPVPFYWTEQFGVRVQVAGFLRPGLVSQVVEEDHARGAFVDLQMAGAALEGVVGWNAPRAFRSYRSDLLAVARASSA